MAAKATLAPATFQNVLFATDFSPISAPALDCAVAICRHNHSSLVVAHIIPPEPYVAPVDALPIMDVERHQAERNMAQLENESALKAYPHKVVLRNGDPVLAILQLIEQREADLVVVGSHGRESFKKLLLGSVAETLVREASCPVLTIGPRVTSGFQESFHHILFATSLSTSTASLRALPYALALANQDGAKLTALRVLEAPLDHQNEQEKARHELQEKLDRIIADMGCSCQAESLVQHGMGSEEIVRIAKEKQVDLIVMGAHRRGSIHLPWTTLHSVLCHADCPVLTVNDQTWHH